MAAAAAALAAHVGMDMTGDGAARIYRPLNELGRGYFGVVFKAQGTNGAFYAAKVLGQQAHVQSVYAHEVAKLQSLGRLQPQCPYHLQLHEAFVDRSTGLHRIVTELVGGGGLDQIM
jgi:hypothetical protein